MELKTIYVIRNRESIDRSITTLEELRTLQDRKNITGYTFKWYSYDDEQNVTGSRSLNVTMCSGLIDSVHCSIDYGRHVLMVVGQGININRIEQRASGAFWFDAVYEGELLLTEEEYFQDMCNDGLLAQVVDAQETYKELFEFISTYF
ncbi:hypothetical protein LZ634_21875 [Kluyvera intermedia]|uniref:hypothetical protein n=1 Tax=Kluyvera intermedia TaxID=61648 RepID=UPI001F2CA2B6|nr:hypothetical protein [Kluyvera intermedia]MCE9891317.1 hypothetical protein [Kluyvera intermedia]